MIKVVNGVDAREQLIEDHAKAVNVDGKVVRIALSDLGGEPQRRSDNSVIPFGRKDCVGRQRLRCAEIGELASPVGRHEHVLRFDIAVHDLVRMEKLNREGDLTRHHQALQQRQRVLARLLVEDIWRVDEQYSRI